MSEDVLPKAVEILAKLVSFDTTSRNSNRALIDYIRDYLDGFGVKSEIVLGQEDGKACLFATIGGSEAGGIVLAGHTDVVPIDDEVWKTDAFKLTEIDGKLYARGSADMKGFIACALAVVPELVKAKLAKPVHLAFTHDEESDMSGAASLTDFMQKRGVKPEWVWVGEPTLHKVIDSHKGVAAFETTITGMSGHSGKPDRGLSAIDLGYDFTTVLRAVAAEKRAKPFSPSRFDPAYTTINLGIVKGGSAENAIAGKWEMLWQTRQHPGDDHNAMLADIDQRALAVLNPRFAAFKAFTADDPETAEKHSEMGCKTCVQFNIPPLLPSRDNVGHKTLGPLTGNAVAEAVSFATEGGFYQQLGTHVVVCGPGSINVAHKANEYIERQQLTDCIDLMRRVLLPSSAQLGRPHP